MAAESLEETRNPVFASVLHVRSEFDRESVCAARCGDRVGVLSGQEQSRSSAAAPAIGPSATGHQMPANVSLYAV